MSETDAPDTERTDDAAFTGDATTHLGDATEVETNELTEDEDGSSPDEPQPETFPAEDDEDPAPAPAPPPDDDDDQAAS